MVDKQGSYKESYGPSNFAFGISSHRCTQSLILKYIADLKITFVASEFQNHEEQFITW